MESKVSGQRVWKLVEAPKGAATPESKHRDDCRYSVGIYFENSGPVGMSCDSDNNNGTNCNGRAEKEKNRSNFIVRFVKRKSKSWDSNQFATILIMTCVEVFAGAVISLQAPFYPDVARKKGAVASEYGLVFGIFEITVLIMSPIYGSKMGFLKPRRVFNWGIVTTAVCCIIFGLLEKIEGRFSFILASLFVRTLEALGDAAFVTASFTIIAIKFPKSVGSSFALLENFYGLGLIIGPTLGGLLYQIGGYGLPFFIMGASLFVVAVIAHLFLPEPSERKQINKLAVESDMNSPKEVVTDHAYNTDITEAERLAQEEAATTVSGGGFQIFKMLQIPVIAMTAYSIVSTAAGIGFLSANLEYHLEKFQLGKMKVGAVFIVTGGTYAMTAPFWGFICDHIDRKKVVTFAGSIFTILGFILIGPVPYFPIDTTLPMTCFGLALFGFGLSAALVSAFLQMLQDSIAYGYPDGLSTYGLVSGLWNSMCALGFFIGPSFGGIFFDLLGFRWSSLFIIGGQLILMVMLCFHYVARCRTANDRQTKESETIESTSDDISTISMTTVDF